MREEIKKDIFYRQVADILNGRLNQLKEENFSKPLLSNIHPPQNVNGRQYKGVNGILLSLLCETKGYKTGVFLTHKQIQDEGIRINKGEKSCYISSKVFRYSKTGSENESISYSEYMNLNEKERTLYTKTLCVRYYSVFNIEQTSFPTLHKDNWEMMCEKYSIEKNRGDDYVNPGLHRIIEEQKWLCPFNISDTAETGYSWNKDIINIHSIDKYPNVNAYYNDALMYMAHSTGHPNRLHREFNTFGDERYRKEFLISAITSSFVGRELGMQIMPHTGYQMYTDLLIEDINKTPYSAVEVLKSSAQSMHLMDQNIADIVNAITGITVIEEPKLHQFIKDGDYVYACGKRIDNTDFKSLVYRRGTDYCYMIGSILDGDMSTHFLDATAKSIYEHIKEQASGTQVLLSEPEKREENICDTIPDICVKTSRRTLDIKDNKAYIIYRDTKYDANAIIETLRKYDIQPGKITQEQWRLLLIGQGLQLDQHNKSVFSIQKTPSGYGMKVLTSVSIKTNQKDKINE